MAIGRVASVNEAVCQGCGACTVACPSGAMDLKRFCKQPDYGGGGCDMQVNETKEVKPHIVAFCCNWCSYAGADLAGTNRLNYPAGCKNHRVPCSCRVNPMFILRPFSGADGVIICGLPSGATAIIHHR